jgi:signal transduction histidine kinase
VNNSAENLEEASSNDNVLFEDAETGDDDLLEDEPPARAREGLPPGFRMRHDAHYVDELMGRDSKYLSDLAARNVNPAPAEEPRPAQPAPEPAAEAAAPSWPAIDALADRLEVVSGYATAARRPAAPLIAFQHALQIELSRASRLARAAGYVTSAPILARREITARELLDRALRAIAPLRRFSGVRFDATLDDPAFAIAADPAAVTQALAGTIDALLHFVHATEAADDAADTAMPSRAIEINIQCVKLRPAVLVEISTGGVALGARALENFFDPASTDHPGGVEPAVLLAAAARIARAHGGRADVRRQGDSGVTVLLVFPRTALQGPAEH